MPATGRGALDPGGAVGGVRCSDSAVAQGFVELTLREAGRYAFVTHVMADAERGAHGIPTVTR